MRAYPDVISTGHGRATGRASACLKIAPLIFPTEAVCQGAAEGSRRAIASVQDIFRVVPRLRCKTALCSERQVWRRSPCLISTL